MMSSRATISWVQYTAPWVTWDREKIIISECALTNSPKKLGPDHLDVATCYNNLGLEHFALVDVEQAKEHHELALTIRLKKFGPDHHDVVTSSLLQRALGDLEQATDHY